ncbi:MAG: ribonuclease III [Lachnospiraceae bacterium]|nr:ribonuclease III [Lachnospiraceae bacterium]MCR4640857.1 ribonuclease III [Lachnospiraceae bacterium]
MAEQDRLAALEEAISYRFRDRSLLTEALTHSSYAHERKINKIACNERLEFLGDAVLELVSSRYIFQRYPQLPEGSMTRLRAALVCEEALAECAARIGLGELLFLGKGEEACGGRRKASVTSDAYEAVLGAMYLDGGLEAVSALIEREVLADCDRHLKEKDPKSELQEFLWGSGRQYAIRYELVEESGPAHEKNFVIELVVDGIRCGRGEGKNKKIAEKEAALRGLEYWKKELQKKCI